MFSIVTVTVSHLSIFVPLLIIHRSHMDLAIKLPATSRRRPASEDVQPGTTIFINSFSCLKNSLSTWALVTGSFFSAIMYLTSSSTFLTFLLEISRIIVRSERGSWRDRLPVSHVPFGLLLLGEVVKCGSQGSCSDCRIILR